MMAHTISRHAHLVHGGRTTWIPCDPMPLITVGNGGSPK